MTLGIFWYLDDYQPVLHWQVQVCVGLRTPNMIFIRETGQSCVRYLWWTASLFSKQWPFSADVALDGTPIFFSILSLTFFLVKYKLFVRNFVSWCGHSSTEELGSFLYVEDVVCYWFGSWNGCEVCPNTFSLKLIAEALSDLVYVHNQSEFQLCWYCPASLCFLKVCTWFTAVMYAQKVWYKETSKFFSMWLEWGYAIKEFNIMVV